MINTKYTNVPVPFCQALIALKYLSKKTSTTLADKLSPTGTKLIDMFSIEDDPYVVEDCWNNQNLFENPPRSLTANVPTLRYSSYKKQGITSFYEELKDGRQLLSTQLKNGLLDLRFNNIFFRKTLPFSRNQVIN